MIKSIYIPDAKSAYYPYVAKSRVLSCNIVGKEFLFHPRNNVIVGPNGCGKSTLLSILKSLMLCENEICSSNKRTTATHAGFYSQSILEPNINPDYANIDFVASYAYKSYNSNFSEINEYGGDKRASMFLIDNFQKRIQSKGESVLFSVRKMFSELSNDIRKKNISFYDRNDFSLTNGTKTFFDFVEKSKSKFSLPKGEKDKITLFFDEPDNNLDILNIHSVMDEFVLNTRDDFQIINVIHNPLIIAKIISLGDDWDGKIIEIEKGYAKKVYNIVKSFLN